MNLSSILGGKAKTGTPAKFSVASVQIIFQTRPGVGDEKIIKNAGDVILYFRGGGRRVVESNNGVYHFDLQSNTEPVLEFLESQFTLRFLKKGDKDTNGTGSITHWQGPLESADTLLGAQQRLQLLGYYTGSADGVMGAKSERAILEFQADEGTLMIDGVAGPKTKKALDAFFQKHGLDSTGANYLIRRYLARFERARVGDTHASCPHPDYRGGSNTVAAYGYKVTAFADRDRGTKAPGNSFFVGLDFDGYSLVDETRLFPKFKKNPNFAMVRLEQASAKHLAEHKYGKPILMITPMVVDGEDTLELHHGSDSGPVVASLDVKTPEMKQVLVTMHLLTIKDAAGNSVPPWTRSEAMGLMDMMNAVWMPMGIEFQVREVQNDTFVGITSGTITDDYSGSVGASLEYKEIWKTFNSLEPERINVYFCESIVWVEEDGTVSSNILGFATTRGDSGPGIPIGACIKRSSSVFGLALTVAHELGHVLELTIHDEGHSDDDGSDIPFRHDIWSRSRLMAMFSKYYLDTPPRLWQSSSYPKESKGVMNGGAWLTVKKIPMDSTDNEFVTARDAAKNPY